MKVSLSWLKDFVDIDVDVQTLADKLVSAGFEIEEMIDPSQLMRNVVLGKILKIEKHPDADKLQICQIDVGQKDLIQIVTGAQNIKENDLVPVAMHDSLLPTGQEIKKGKLRGVDSNGMLCSGEELKLTEADYKGASVYGILIMNDEKFPVGTDMNVVLGNDDVILDVGVTANRPDCNSILGIAREVAAVLDKPLKMPNLEFKTTLDEDTKDNVTVKVLDNELCPRYMACCVKDIKICPSPEVIVKRLKSVGIRSINNIVDITNYVLTEIGQPMHAFDLANLEGNQIVVRRAENEEKIVTLDEKEYTLDDTMLVIADKTKPCAMAGIMGGLNSGINDKTNTIVFESAKFLRDNIRRTSRKLNLRSDSSFRYERGIDFGSQQLGLFRALSLISEYNYGKISKSFIDECSSKLEENVVVTSCDAICKILGIKIEDQVIVDILNKLQIKTTLKGDTLECVAPLYRDDIENANDLAEEVIRMYGYDKIVNTMLDAAHQTQGGYDSYQKKINTIKEICVNKGYSEALSYSFISPKGYDVLGLEKDSPLRNYVELLNPLGEDMSVMRTTLAYSMLNILSTNITNFVSAAKFFEIATVYEPKQLPLTDLPNEHQNLMLGAYGEDVDFYTNKAVITKMFNKFALKCKVQRSKMSFLHLGRSCDFMVGNDCIGYTGEVHPDVLKAMGVKTKLYITEIDLAKVNKYGNYKFKFEAIGKFPPSTRDYAIVVDEDVAVGDILEVIKKNGGKILNSVKVFDIYRNKETFGEDKKSVAFSLEFRVADRTLTTDEVQQKMDDIHKKVTKDFGAQLR